MVQGEIFTLLCHPMIRTDTIAAIATPTGVGAIAMIRLSGIDAIAIAQQVWRGKPLTAQATHTVEYGFIIDGGEPIDEVLCTVFHPPRTFTGEPVVEITTHGAPYIAERVLTLLVQQGARLANPGEFTMRAFMNGRIDLAQAEAVADLIAAQSATAHHAALHQLRGGFSTQLKDLRERLVTLAALLELELDFSEEDVTFADRPQLTETIHDIQQHIRPLMASFKYGNAIKHGVNVVIAGKPNAGKSTLLNILLQEERAIVSPIAGTTRDTIEETIQIDGIVFRFIDTAGLRHTDESIEAIGVQRTMDKVAMADIVIYLYDCTDMTDAALTTAIHELSIPPDKIVVAANKVDMNPKVPLPKADVKLAAKTGIGLAELQSLLVSKVSAGTLTVADTIVTNVRHYEALTIADTALSTALSSIHDDRGTELIAADLRLALQALGVITGHVTNEEILGNIFSKFCIGK